MTTPVLHKGIVKQVLSGDCIVVRDKPRGGPPPERTIALSNIVAPRLARRPAVGNVGERFQADSKDEPMAWAAREFLRKKLIGKEVSFTVEHKIASGREYGYIYLANNGVNENIAESVISEGMAEVRRANVSIMSANEQYQKLIQLEDTAKSAGKGKWSPEASQIGVRQIVWNIDNPISFVETRHSKSLIGIIEHVRDGSTYRVCLLPNEKDGNYYNITLMLSGIKAPGFKLDGDSQTADPYAEEARFFVESRLLQREIQVKLETSSNQNLVGSVIHPNGNIAELLVKEGYSHCVDWSMGSVSGYGGAAALRTAEKEAKEKCLRIWKNWTPPAATVSNEEMLSAPRDVIGSVSISPGKVLNGKVVEVGNGDNIVVKFSDDKASKFFLSSVRAPRPSVITQANQPAGPNSNKNRPRPLYDIPYMFEAREFLRKKLIGKKVKLRVDYIQPKEELPSGMGDRVCATVHFGEINIGEALVTKGLASVVRYKATDENRSSTYDLLLAAEANAQKKAIGIHSKKDTTPLRITDLAGDVAKSKNFLPFLKRGGRLEAIVEFVAGGSRLRLYVPKESCIITLLLAGIDCPRAPRRLPDGSEEGGEPFGEEAIQFTKDHVLQREVEIEIDNMDKGGNYIGWLYIDSGATNMSISLVENGLAKVHFTAEFSNHFTALARAEDKAKEKRLNIWTLEANKKELQVDSAEDLIEEKAKDTATKDVKENERKTMFKQSFIPVVHSDLRFYAQYDDNGPQIERISLDMNNYYAENPAVIGAYTPRKGDLCASKFIDGCWYRARVKDCSKPQAIAVFYIDFGNEEVTQANNLAALPHTLSALPAGAQEFRLAFVKPPPDEEDRQFLDRYFMKKICEQNVKVNAEYEHPDGGVAASVLLQENDVDRDLAELLLKEGLLLVESRRDRRYKSVLTKYEQLQNQAMKARINIWRYGDIRADEA